MMSFVLYYKCKNLRKEEFNQIMEYSNVVLNGICMGLVSPRYIKEFLDSLLEMIFENGFSDIVLGIFDTIKRFEDCFFKYEETCNHLVKEFIS